MQSEITVPVFKIRCSAIGQIMTEPKGKSVAEQIAELQAEITERQGKYFEMKPGLKTTIKALEMLERKQSELRALEAREGEPNLSQTCKTYLKKWLYEKIYQRRAEFTSKQTTKGNAVEDDAILYAADKLGWGLASKNEKNFSNEYFHGTPDVILDDEVDDTKASYTHETFPLYDSELPEKYYEWQVLGYMELTGKRKGKVIFCLMSMPEDIILKEARWKLKEGYTEQEYEEFAAQFRYDDLPTYLRIREYEIEYNEAKIRAIESRVLECRRYIETVLMPEVEKQFKKYQKLKSN